MSKQKKQMSSKGRSKSDIVPDTSLILDYEGKPTPGPNISTFPIPKNFSVLNLDLENPADLRQNMEDCIGLHRFWTYVNTDKRYRSPQGSMSWKVPKSGTYFQYVKYRNNLICLVEIASQSWLKGVITKKGVAEFQDAENDETATYITTNLPKIILKSKGNYMPDVDETKLGLRWLMKSFDSVFNHITGDGDCGNLVEAFTIIVVHFWDTVRNDEVKDLVLASFDPSIFATHYLGSRPVGLMKKWKRCCRQAIKWIENREPYKIQRDTNPTSASELLQVVRVLYRDDQDRTPINDDSMPIKLNGVDELRHENHEGEYPAPGGGGQASGSNPPTPKYPNWILDSFSEPNGQQHGQGERSYAWASKMASIPGTEDICDTRDKDQSCTTGGFFTVENTENTNVRGTERLQPLLLNGQEMVLNPREYDGDFTIDGSWKESTSWRAKSLVRRGYHMAFSLMKKFTDTQNIDAEVVILSDISLDHGRGFTLVEAEKSCDIAEASKRFDLSRGTSVNIKDITADDRWEKLLTKLRPKVDHQAISKEADKNKRVTVRQARCYSLQLQVLNIIVKDGMSRLNTVAVAPVENWKMLHLAKTNMVAVAGLAGEGETRGMAREIGRTMIRRGPFIEDGCSCWSEAADCDANTKGSTKREALLKGSSAGGVVTEMIRQAGKMQTAKAVSPGVALISQPC